VSSFKMMHRFFELREPVVNLMALIGEPVLQTLSWSDWDVVARACELMMPLYETTAEVSSDNYMSASKAIVMVRGLQRLCRDQLALPGHPPTIEKMASIILSSLTNWFGNMELNPLLAESTLLDPRFKMTGFADAAAANVAKRNIIESASRALLNSDSDKSDAVVNTSQSDIAVLEDFADSKRQQTVTSIWAEYDKKVSGITAESSSHLCSSNTTASLPVSNKTMNLGDPAVFSVWSEYDQKVSNIAVAESPEVEATKQMQRFLDEPLLGRHSSSLEWWQTREALYPRLAPIVKERLCIVANSVSSEFAFSRTAHLLNIRRCSLSPCEMRFQFFVHSNINT
jgi:zinc finger BED domain-containing protein 1 (E3 SUMO-protein ligase ZBED1)